MRIAPDTMAMQKLPPEWVKETWHGITGYLDDLTDWVYVAEVVALTTGTPYILTPENDWDKMAFSEPDMYLFDFRKERATVVQNVSGEVSLPDPVTIEAVARDWN